MVFTLGAQKLPMDAQHAGAPLYTRPPVDVRTTGRINESHSWCALQDAVNPKFIFRRNIKSLVATLFTSTIQILFSKPPHDRTAEELEILVDILQQVLRLDQYDQVRAIAGTTAAN